MTDGELRALKGYYGSLRGQKKQLDTAADQHRARVLVDPQFSLIAQEIERVCADFPRLLPPFDRRTFADGSSTRTQYFSVEGLRAYLAAALARIEAAIESDEPAPVIQRRVFAFIQNSELREIAERDDEEAQRAWVARCWKSVIVLAGGIIEAILLDLLQRDGRAKSAKNAASEGDLSRWSLGTLIAVALELKLVSAGIEKLSESVREFRDLVHPGREVRKRLAFGMEEARIALDVVNILRRELK